MEYIPAIAVLASFLILVLIIFRKFSSSDLIKIVEGKNTFLFVGLFLFVTLLVMHLFKEQTWTAGALQVVGGVLLGGAGAVSVSQTAIGKYIKQAMGDIIERMEGDIKELKDSVINQYSSVENQSQPLIERAESFKVEGVDPEFVHELEKIRKSKNEWFPTFIDKCLENPEIRRKIEEKITTVSVNGWRVVELGGLDSFGNGLAIRIKLVKPLSDTNL